MAELPLVREEQGLTRGVVYPHEAMYYTKLPEKQVQCLLCGHRCRMLPGEAGFCRVRINREGTLYTTAFSNPCATYAEPVEKEPMYHFLPGSKTLSVAVAGCNLRCSFCQNWLITQFPPEESMNYSRFPKDILELAVRNSCSAVNYTYSEPTVFYEYMLEIVKLVRSAGIRNICHTNGFISEGALRDLCGVLDAICVDLKGFEEDFYKNICSGKLDTVLRSLRIIKQEKVHLEIVALIIPGMNDNPDIIRRMCGWVAENLGRDTPLHFLKFYARYKLKDLDSTPLQTLEDVREIASSCGLHYSYISNIPFHSAKNTYCPRCANTLVERENNATVRNVLNDEGTCPRCNFKVTGVWR